MSRPVILKMGKDYTGYHKPASGIPKSDLSQSVKNSLLKADEANIIAKGRNRAIVFETADEMYTWISDESNKNTRQIGDNIYIKAISTPDYWISEVLDEADGDGYYYHVSPLETQKVDLNNYFNKEEINAAIDEKYSKPADGIPYADLEETVQNTLDLAATALQPDKEFKIWLPEGTDKSLEYYRLFKINATRWVMKLHLFGHNTHMELLLSRMGNQASISKRVSVPFVNDQIHYARIIYKNSFTDTESYVDFCISNVFTEDNPLTIELQSFEVLPNSYTGETLLEYVEENNVAPDISNFLNKWIWLPDSSDLTATTITAPNFKGNADTATKLKTSVAINEVLFDGSVSINTNLRYASISNPTKGHWYRLVNLGSYGRYCKFAVELYWDADTKYRCQVFIIESIVTSTHDMTKDNPNSYTVRVTDNINGMINVIDKVRIVNTAYDNDKIYPSVDIHISDSAILPDSGRDLTMSLFGDVFHTGSYFSTLDDTTNIDKEVLQTFDLNNLPHYALERTLSYAEYQALPLADKMNGVHYYCPDAPDDADELIEEPNA